MSKARRRRFKKSRRAQRWAAAIVVASIGTALYFGYRAYDAVTDYPLRAGKGSDQTIEFEIARGSTSDEIIAALIDAEILEEEDRIPFKLFVLHRGAANQITAGKHSISGSMSPEALLQELMTRHRAPEVKVTIPEGKNSLQIAQILASKGLSSEEELLGAMQDKALLKKFGIHYPSMEGYLFPDTYKFRKDASAEQVLKRLLDRHRKVFSGLRKEFHQGARKLESDFGWGGHQILTLASIVEKETGAAKERSRIAGVFLNRLRFPTFNPKLLQTDPTIIYGCTMAKPVSNACKSFEGRIRRIHLKDKENPYNTYTHEGLPPGPISNPGKASLRAVLQPEKSKYLYFVSRNDGTHYFSRTRSEHEDAVDRFIRGNEVGDGTVQQ